MRTKRKLGTKSSKSKVKYIYLVEINTSEKEKTDRDWFPLFDDYSAFETLEKATQYLKKEAKNTIKGKIDTYIDYVIYDEIDNIYSKGTRTRALGKIRKIELR